MRLIGIGELRQWLRTLGDAARARAPSELVGGADEPDDRQLDGYLLRAAVLGAAARWTRGQMLPAVEAGYRDQGHDALAGLTREMLGLRDLTAAVPVPGLGTVVSMALTLGAIALAVAVTLRWSGRRPLSWRTVLAVALATYLVFALWGLAGSWFALQAGAFHAPSTDEITVWRLVVLIVAAGLSLAALLMPAIALGRATRIVAPGLRRPFTAGVVAWLAALACSTAFTLSGAERALIGFLVPPAT